MLSAGYEDALCLICKVGNHLTSIYPCSLSLDDGFAAVIKECPHLSLCACACVCMHVCVGVCVCTCVWVRPPISCWQTVQDFSQVATCQILAVEGNNCCYINHWINMGRQPSRAQGRKEMVANNTFLKHIFFSFNHIVSFIRGTVLKLELFTNLRQTD